MMWQRTQLGFAAPQQLQIPTFPGSAFPDKNRIPQRMSGLVASSAGVVPSMSAPHLTSQLQFNMGFPTSHENLATRFRKPKPIVIEKLDGQQNQAVANQTFVSKSNEGQLFPISTSSSVSSDRLAFAIDLARRDIKKARFNSSANTQVSQTEEAQARHNVATAVKDQQVKGTGPRRSKVKKANQTQKSKETVSLRERVQKTLRKHEEERQGVRELHFFSAPGQEVDIDADGENHQTKEIRKLRRELHHCMKQMDELQHHGPAVLRNRDKRIKQRTEDELRLSLDEPDKRQVVRAEEQAARSSRMLYMLQRQVQDLQDELSKKGENIKHTKKSKTLNRLAAAHRAALRALQTFISQAPLQPKVGHGLPPMYQDLAILIRQLSLLTTQLQIGNDDLADDVLTREPKYTRGTSGYQPRPSAFVKEMDAVRRVNPKGPPPPTKRNLQIIDDPNTPNPSPERDAVLRAGLQALMRARENITQTPYSAPKAPILSRPQPQAVPVKKSVLLPAQLKAKRERAQLAARQVNKPVNMDLAHFAQDTVSSKLRKVMPTQADEELGVEQPLTSPPRTPTKQLTPSKSPRGTPIKRHGSLERLCEHVELSPRSPRRRLMQESPRSPKYPRRMLPQGHDLMEREIARQAWLDREAQRRVQELGELHRKEHHLDEHMSEGVQLARRMIKETEDAIVHRLRPLLDRAGAIVEENDQREQQKKRSLHHQLANLASKTTMSQADSLAEKILDDLLEETVDELQRLDTDDYAEDMASGMQNVSTLENILHKLQSFEKEENDIRRRWQQVKYAEPDAGKSTNTTAVKQSGRVDTANRQDPAPIMFTQPGSTHHRDFVRDSVKKLRQRSRARRREASADSHDSTASLLEGISSPTGSSEISEDVPFRRSTTHKGLVPLAKPKIALFVPSELRASIATYRSKYDKFLRDTATHVHGTFNPWDLVERISEDLLDDLVQDVAGELGFMCDDYTEGLCTQEFAAVNGGIAHLNRSQVPTTTQ